MPVKTINDYTFYKIVCLDDSVELCYVGSTANFNKRRREHKHHCNNETSKKYNHKIYTTIRENGGWENFKMVEISKREQLTKRQAEQIEEEYRQELKANMNSIKCYRTEEYIIEFNKQRYKNYNENNRDMVLERKKQFYQNNIDKITEYSNQYYQNNRDKIEEHRKEKVTCECGCEIRRDYLSGHRKTKKHIDLLNA